MPTKKKQVEEPEEELEEPVLMGEPTKTEPPAKASPESVEPICLNCQFLSQGDMGPTCVNPESPNYQQRMSETGTCEVFTAKVKH